MCDINLSKPKGDIKRYYKVTSGAGLGMTKNAVDRLVRMYKAWQLLHGSDDNHCDHCKLKSDDIFNRLCGDSYMPVRFVREQGGEYSSSEFCIGFLLEGNYVR